MNGAHPEINESLAYYVVYLVATIPEADPNSPPLLLARVNEAERKERWWKKGKDAELGKRRKKKFPKKKKTLRAPVLTGRSVYQFNSTDYCIACRNRPR